MKNRNLHTAKKKKNDEFYTQYEDVKKEVDHYADQLKDKIIFCNCDDSNQSNFYKYFSDNFEILGLKELISSNADFRSEESIEILKECDIAITNPPFSLFREYIAQLMEYDKKFLVIGNYNAITYKEVFGFIKENKMWLGISPRSMNFKKSDGSIDVVNACWFTNLDNRKRHIDLIRDVLYKKYNEVDYPKYDNYDAINVDKTNDIPVDYFGYMGVPITYLTKHNPNQFEIIESNSIRLNENVPFKSHGLIKDKDGSVNGINKYVRIVIKRNPDQFEILGAECFEDIETSTNVFQKPTHKLENSNREVYKRLWIKRKLK